MDKQAFYQMLWPAVSTAGRLAIGALSAKSIYDQAPSFARDISSGSWGDAGKSGLGLAASALGVYGGFGGRAGRLLSRGVPRAMSAAGLPTFAKAYGAAAAGPRAIRLGMGMAGSAALRPWSAYAAGQRTLASGLRSSARAAAGSGRLGAALSSSVRSLAPSLKGLRPAGVVGTGIYAGAYALPGAYAAQPSLRPAVYAPQPQVAPRPQSASPVGPMRLFGSLGGMVAPAYSDVRPWA